jgi:hypothetical protein
LLAVEEHKRVGASVKARKDVTNTLVLSTTQATRPTFGSGPVLTVNALPSVQLTETV